jgi:hypothetical protein
MRSASIALALCLAALGVLAVETRAADSSAPAATGERAKWAEHMGDIPFVIGSANGMSEAEFSGKPPIYFFTADY